MAPSAGTDDQVNTSPGWFKELAETNFAKHLPDWPDLTVLQIGVYTGDATAWLLKHRDVARIVDVDTWLGDPQGLLTKDMEPVEATYDRRFADNAKVTKMKMTSDAYFGAHDETFDFVYIDGDHNTAQVAIDALQGARRVKPGGILAFDDYLWELWRDPLTCPKLGIDLCQPILSRQFEVIDASYQLWLKCNE